ncbi:CAAX protease self-immunity [Butyrivibrio sp. Su6]|uniref:CPBP family intramembrane glutamic endopeptidase n=1 Tax=Butyrivibrio sp. Su6 TaxID=1520810 RepID=UPI00089F1F44|nr:type II CAAX endopeptidase family protein [Butyrivibrio sp. Su6]SEG41043.1 CAAX protease self-immunity [Butyrivibrio sp. Su6]
MIEANNDKKSIVVFYVITLLISAVVEGITIITGCRATILILMWVPGIVGIICSRVFYPKAHALGVKKFKPRYLLLAILIPNAYLIPSYMLSWAILKDPTIGVDELAQRFTNGIAFDIPGICVLFIAFIPMLILSMVTAAGEELGWRGYAFPILARLYGTKKAILINGSIWAVWHMPIILSGQYQASVNIIYGLISFFIEVMILTMIFCWSRNSSGSVIPAIILHASHNLVDQSYLQPLSTNANVPYLSGEQGIITIIVGALVAIVLWSVKNKE